MRFVFMINNTGFASYADENKNGFEDTETPDYINKYILVVLGQ